MLDNMYKKAAGEYIVTERKKGWFVSAYNTCLCEIDFSGHKGKILNYLGYTAEEIKRIRFSGVIKYGDYLYLYPDGENHIAVYNLSGEEIKTIGIKPLVNSAKMFREGRAKVKHAVLEGKYIFFLGYEYPAIIRLDTQTDQIDYITDWVEEVDGKVNNNKFFGYFTEGYEVKGDKLYLPIGCIPGILELDVNTLHSRVIDIHTTAGGIAGMTKIEEDTYCLSCGEENATRILLWDMKNNNVEKEVSFDTQDELTNPLHAVLHIGSKLYLPILTWAFDKVQEYNLETSELKENATLSQLDYLYLGEFLGSLAMMSVFVEDNKIIHFATGKDFSWHEYNTETDILESYDIFFEGSEEIYDRIFAEKMRVFASIGEIVKEKELPLEGLINCALND